MSTPPAIVNPKPIVVKNEPETCGKRPIVNSRIGPS